MSGIHSVTTASRQPQRGPGGNSAPMQGQKRLGALLAVAAFS